jgi:hypothetical protein
MTSDAHQLQPDHLPTPFTADEIRLGCGPGRTVRALVIEPGIEPYVRVTQFVDADDEGADQAFWTEATNGAQLSEPRPRRSTWLEFQGHASMPADSTVVSEEQIDIPAGRFDCLKYVRTDGDSVSTFWFARSAPGMPLMVEERLNGELVYSSTAIENLPGGAVEATVPND